MALPSKRRISWRSECWALAFLLFFKWGGAVGWFFEGRFCFLDLKERFKRKVQSNVKAKLLILGTY